MRTTFAANHTYATAKIIYASEECYQPQGVLNKLWSKDCSCKLFHIKN